MTGEKQISPHSLTTQYYHTVPRPKYNIHTYQRPSITKQCHALNTIFTPTNDPALPHSATPSIQYSHLPTTQYYRTVPRPQYNIHTHLRPSITAQCHALNTIFTPTSDPVLPHCATPSIQYSHPPATPYSNFIELTESRLKLQYSRKNYLKISKVSTIGLYLYFAAPPLRKAVLCCTNIHSLYCPLFCTCTAWNSN